MATAIKSLSDLTTAELTSLKAEVYGVLREQERRLYAVPGQELERSRNETMKFMRRVDDELYRRSA